MDNRQGALSRGESHPYLYRSKVGGDPVATAGILAPEHLALGKERDRFGDTAVFADGCHNAFYGLSGTVRYEQPRS